MTSWFSDMTSTTNFLDVVLFFFSSLVTGPSFMSISSLVLKLWQFSFIRDWPEIQKSEIPTSEFFPISWDWGELWTPNLTWMSLIECYWMLLNSRVTTFTFFELLRENQLGDKITSPLQIRVNKHLRKICNFCFLILASKTLRSIIRGLYFQNLQHDATIKLRIYLLLSLISKERKKIW